MATTPTTSPITVNAHLHYGGSQNARTGMHGPKPHAGATYKKHLRFETMVRMEAAMLPEAQIAAMLSLSVPRLRYLKRSQDYLNARMRITKGIILDTAGDLALIREQRKEVLAANLPAALQVLANELLQPATTLMERKHKTAVALELLDREGTFAKVSRAEIKPVDAFDFEKADMASRSIINAIRGIAPPTQGEHSHASVAANREFSNSHTLSAVDQQAALDTLEATYLEMLPTEGLVN